MMDIRETVDLLTRGAEFVRNHVPADRLPDPTLTAAVTILAGLILAFFGARFLRAIVVLVFVLIGSTTGVRIAQIGQVDLLIGLVLGAGLAGFMGYVFYRWWVGILAGSCAVFLVMAIGGVRLLPQEIQAFEDQRLGVQSETYVLPSGPATQTTRIETLHNYLTELGTYFWGQRRNLVIRFGVAAIVALLLGVIFGVTLPKFTMIVGTSLLGVTALAVGTGTLLAVHLPSLWGIILSNGVWSLVTLGIVLIGSLWFQARYRAVPAAAPAQSVNA